MRQKIIKTGNSLAVVVPSNFVKTVGVQSGQEVEVRLVPEAGQVVYTFSGAKQLSITNHLKIKLNQDEV
jgi:antitoxin component of MazEF toxin-antitoxin module